MNNKERMTLTAEEASMIRMNRNVKIKVKENVLVIGDLHEPFCLDGYLEFCINTYKNNRS